MKTRAIITILLVMFFCSSYKNIPLAELKINITNIQHLKGSIKILVFKGSDGFPNDYKKAVYAKSFPAKYKSLSKTIENLPYGSYAIAILHDINDNNQADKNFFGIPTEPFGFSNYTSLTFGTPSYSDVSFNISSAQKVINIKLIEI